MKRTFGQLAREYFQHTGWSQAELARRTGYSATHIGNILQDRSPTAKSGKPSRLPEEVVDKIAKVLQIPLAEARSAAGLAAPENASTPTAAVVAAAPETLEDALLYYFRQIPPEYRADALSLVAAYYRQFLTATAAPLDPADVEPSDEELAAIGLKRGELLYDVSIIGKG